MCDRPECYNKDAHCYCEFSVVEHLDSADIELEDCPFCRAKGRDNVWILGEKYDNGEEKWYLGCHVCDMEVRPRASKEAIVDAWNTRYPAQLDEYEYLVSSMQLIVEDAARRFLEVKNYEAKL